MKKSILFVFLLFSSVVECTEYYVKNTGNDSNSGTSDAQAWAHHPWMIGWTGRVVLKPGDVVYMKRGDTWTITNPATYFMTATQSGTSGNPITTTCYGTITDPLPLINISTATNYCVIYANAKSYLTFDHLHVTHHSSTYFSGRGGYEIQRSGMVFVGTTNPCHDITVTNCEVNNCPYAGIVGETDCYNMVIGDVTASTTATTSLYSNHVHDYGYAGIICQGVNPGNNISNFKIYYNYVHDCTFPKGETLGGVYGIAVTANPSSHGWPQYAWVRYNNVQNILQYECIDTHGGSYIYFQDNYCKGFGSTGIVLAHSSDFNFPHIADHIYIERNIIEQVPSGYWLGHQNAFIGIFSNALVIPSDIYIRDNIIRYTIRPTTGVFYGIKVNDVNGGEISGNQIYNGPTSNNVYSAIYNSPGPANLADVDIHNNFIDTWNAYGFQSRGSDIDGTVNIYNNIINSGTAAAIYITTAALASTAAVTLYNNTLLTTTASSVIRIDYGTASGSSLIAKNNIIGATASDATYYWYSTAAFSGTFTCDYNLYWNSSNANPFYQGNSPRDWTSWTTTLGHDTHGVGPNTSPRFISSGGSYRQDLDFALQSTSPAINKGADVGLPTDYTGNPISGLPDIGAFEYQTVANPSPILMGSVVENAAPSRLEMTYSLALANIVPAASAFTVKVNSTTRTVSSVAILGTKVLLTLSSPVKYGDVVTVAYTKPSANPLQTVTGGKAATISASAVKNMVVTVKSALVAVVSSPKSSYSGFVSEINASESYDTNNGTLSYEWIVPDKIPVSSTNDSKIQFLCPVVNKSQTVEFTLKISNSDTTQVKTLPVEILPYKPELEVAEISSIEASSFQAPNYPSNIIDGNIGTMWSANGDNQWLIIELKEPFIVQHFKLAFQSGQKEETYFDILGSENKVDWEPILTKSSSCAFSGDIQVFNSPPSKAEAELKYIKLVGHCNSADSGNYISEFKIFGYSHRKPSSYEKQPVKLYPNPAHDFINIRIDEPTLVADFIKICNLTGKVIFQDEINPDMREFQFPLNLHDGIYILQLLSHNLILFTQKLIIAVK